MLEEIKSPDYIKNLSQSQLTELAQEIRQEILQVVGKNGGHLASNLGVVELTIALHRVFNIPEDAIVFDVSHQCYAHKLLTGRYALFNTLRKQGGISGFTNIDESDCDYFTAGHASTSISSALGLLTAWNLEKKDGKVIAVIGDGALTGGMAFEALSHTGQLGKNLIVILNDNQMSIDHNTGALSRYLSRLSMSSNYQSFKNRFDSGVEKVPVIGKGINKVIRRLKRSIKGMVYTNNLFTDLGFEYAGPLDGHNEQELESVFKKAKKLSRPVVIHVVTKKGCGYSPAENNPELFHGIGPFQISDGKVEKFDKLSFTEAFSNMIIKKGAENKKLVCITAAMAKGTGLTAFSHEFPDRFFDVGIAEEHAVTFAGGLSKGGLIPVVCIYSTFIQRSVDQMIHDITLQRSKSIFMLDRAGAVPDDGCTHQGIFDISLFRPIPDLQIMSPVSAKDLECCFDWAVNSEKAVVIRYPKLPCPEEIKEFEQPVREGRGIFIRNSFQKKNSESSILIVCTGGMYSEVGQAVKALGEKSLFSDILVLRFIKPFDEKYFVEVAKKYKGILFVEDGIVTGGISEYLKARLIENHIINSEILAFEEKYYNHANRAQILEDAGLSPEHIQKAAMGLLNASPSFEK